MAMKSWVPTTNAVVQVQSTSTLVLPANPDAVIRVIHPLDKATLWMGLGVTAQIGIGAPISIFRPWFEKADEVLELMYRGSLELIHNFEAGVEIPVLVLEGEEVV